MQQYKIIYYWVGLCSKRVVRYGRVWALSSDQVVHRLYKINVIPISVKSSWWMLAYPPYWWRHWVAIQNRNQLLEVDIVFFFKTVAVLMQGHFSLYEAVRLVSVSAPSRGLQYAAHALTVNLARGASIAESFLIDSGRWPELVGLVCGAVSGTGRLHEIFLYLASAFHLAIKCRDDIKQALFIPLVTGLAAVIVFGGGLVVCSLYLDAAVVPTSITWLAQYAMYGVIVLLLVLGCVWQLCSFFNQAHAYRDAMILHMPFFGSLIVQGHAILFFTLLAILLRAGVPLVPALKGIVTAMPNAYWRLCLRVVVRQLEQGHAFSTSVAFLPLYTVGVLFCAGVKTAHNAEQLVAVCQNSATLAQEQRSFALTQVAIFLPVVLMVFIGVCIAFGLYIAFQAMAGSVNAVL